MKISEMNECIEKMRECYNFNDDETEIRLGDFIKQCSDNFVMVHTRDKNGTSIEMSREIDYKPFD